MTKLLKTNEEIVLYRNALERKNFTRIESAIQDELEQLAELLMCAELAGDFHLGDSRQLTDKSLLPFDLVS